VANLEIEGVDNVLKKLEELGAKGRRIENSALRSAGDRVKGAIQDEVPVRTGNLKRNIAVSNVRTKDGVKHVEIGPNKDGWYGRFVEFGTVHIKANPFMSRGYEKSKEDAVKIIQDELKKELGL